MVSAMCKLLNLPRSTYYYSKKPKEAKDDTDKAVAEAFRRGRGHYGTRKIKASLLLDGFVISRRRIRESMKRQGLKSSYTVKKYHHHVKKCNEDAVPNVLNREFDNRAKMDVVVGDLTYVNVSGKWHYICILLDIHNRELIGYSAGRYKDAGLVKRAFHMVRHGLNNINIFHTDRGSEFKNKALDEILDTFGIRRSLSSRGCPYDNAVAEAAFKIIKTEFVKNLNFDTLEQMELLLFDYVHWYNNHRLHSSLGYLSPIQYRSSRPL